MAPTFWEWSPLAPRATAEKAQPGLVTWCWSVSLSERTEDILIYKNPKVKSGLLKVGNETGAAYTKLENILNLTFLKLLSAESEIKSEIISSH